MVESSTRIKVLERLAQSTTPAADEAIRRACEQAIASLADGVDYEALEFSLDVLLTVDNDTWREEAALVHPHYERFGAHTPQALWDQLAALEQRLQ